MPIDVMLIYVIPFNGNLLNIILLNFPLLNVIFQMLLSEVSFC